MFCVRNNVRYVPIGFELLPRNFMLTQLQHLYEVILGRALDKRNFPRRRSLWACWRKPKEHEQGVSHRAARLYRFDAEWYAKLVKKGFNFECDREGDPWVALRKKRASYPRPQTGEQSWHTSRN